jgi:hypothetical protein
VNLAALLALLLASGACAETDFRGADGAVLSVVVCPRVIPPGDAPPPGSPTAAPPSPFVAHSRSAMALSPD